MSEEINERDRIVYITNGARRINAIYLSAISEEKCLIWAYTTNSGRRIEVNITQIRKEPWKL